MTDRQTLRCDRSSAPQCRHLSPHDQRGDVVGSRVVAIAAAHGASKTPPANVSPMSSTSSDKTEDVQTAIRLAKRMIVDGRMPAPEEAHHQLKHRLERECLGVESPAAWAKTAPT